VLPFVTPFMTECSGSTTVATWDNGRGPITHDATPCNGRKIATDRLDCESTVRKISSVWVSGKPCLHPRFSDSPGQIANLGTIRLSQGKFFGPVSMAGLHGPCLMPQGVLQGARCRALSIRLKASRQPRRFVLAGRIALGAGHAGATAPAGVWSAKRLIGVGLAYPAFVIAK